MRIVLIGAGNLANRLGIALSTKRGVQVVQVWSRTETAAQALARKIGCSYTSDLNNLVGNADLYLLAVTDNAIETVLRNAPLKGKNIAHTAGSMAMDVLNSFSDSVGVFYPLQSFTVSRVIDFSTIPIFIEANNDGMLGFLQELALSLSEKVHIISSSQRLQIHLAAVFICNFVNHLYAIGEQLSKEHQIDFNFLKPLLFETANRIENLSPFAVQTGPAIRQNQEIIDIHLALLEDHPSWKEIYHLISKDIALTHYTK